MRANFTNYIRAWGNGSALITGCTFEEPSNITYPLFYARENGTVYTDDATVRVRTDNGPTVRASPVADVPEFPPDSTKAFLQRNDPWFSNVLDVRPFLTVSVRECVRACPSCPCGSGHPNPAAPNRAM